MLLLYFNFFITFNVTVVQEMLILTFNFFFWIVVLYAGLLLLVNLSCGGWDFLLVTLMTLFVCDTADSLSIYFSWSD